MGREMRRREERKNKNIIEKKQEVLDTSIKGSTIIKLILIVALILFALYFVVAVFITKEIKVTDNSKEETSDTSTDTNGVSNRILATSTFQQAEEVYYVYYYDFNDSDDVVENAISGKSDLKIYRVDTSSSLNNKYVTEESGNKAVTGINDLKVKNPTLLQITNDQVTGYYEGSTSIIDFLNQ